MNIKLVPLHVNVLIKVFLFNGLCLFDKVDKVVRLQLNKRYKSLPSWKGVTSYISTWSVIKIFVYHDWKPKKKFPPLYRCKISYFHTFVVYIKKFRIYKREKDSTKRVELRKTEDGPRSSEPSFFFFFSIRRCSDVCQTSWPVTVKSEDTKI